jgi:DNA-binding winged helix-turn-helix (wHTH) protein/tetratricopeptide (TPR) repeat protein
VIYRFENCTLDVERRELCRDGALRNVEPQVFDLLTYLIANRDRVVTRDEVFDAVWRGRIVSDGVLNTRLNAARSAIGDSGQDQRLIRTLPRRGLRFVGAVLEDESPDRVRPEPRSATRSLLPHRIGNSSQAPAVAVLPLAILSGTAQARVFAEWLSDEVVAALWRHEWLSVAMPARLTQSGLVPPQLCDALRGEYALQGGVTASGENLHVAVRLFEKKTRHHLWAHSTDVPADNLSAQCLAATIAGHVSDHIFAAQALRVRLKDAANNLWSSIIAALAMIDTRDKRKIAAARQLLLRLIVAEPDCAPVHALLSFIATLQVHLGWRTRKAMREEAFGFARRAMACDSDDAWSHLALGYAKLYVRGEPDEAIASLHDALNFNPNLSMAHYLIALSSAYSGDTVSAFRHADRAEALSSSDLLARGNAGVHDIVRATTSFVAERYSDGVAYARAALAANPRQVPAYRQLVINGALAGESEQARSALRTVRRLAPDTGKFIRDSANVWRDRHVYQRYVDAFRMAGFKQAR